MWMSPKPLEFLVAVSASRPHWNKLNTTTEYITATLCFSRFAADGVYSHMFISFLMVTVVLVYSFVRWYHRTQSTPKSTPWFSTATSKTEITCFFFHLGWVLLSFPLSRFKGSRETLKRDLLVLWTLSLVSSSSLCFCFLFFASLCRKNFVAPALSEGFSEILHVHFVPKFENSDLETLFSQFSEGWSDSWLLWQVVKRQMKHANQNHVGETNRATYNESVGTNNCPVCATEETCALCWQPHI